MIFSAGSQVLGGMKDKEARKIFREVEGPAFRRKKTPRSVGSENHSNPGKSCDYFFLIKKNRVGLELDDLLVLFEQESMKMNVR